MSDTTPAARLPHDGYFADPARPVALRPGSALTIQELVAVARGDGCGRYATVKLEGDWRERCARSAAYVREAVRATMGKSPDELADLARASMSAAATSDRTDADGDGDAPSSRPEAHEDTDALAMRALVYGVTTGFGHLKNRPIDSVEAASDMQTNLLRSHATGVGPPMPTEVVRAMMLIRMRTFVEGHSGVRPELVALFCDMLNRRVHPWVPQQGSVGASGDLCPLSHLALALIGEGMAWLEPQPDNAETCRSDHDGFALLGDQATSGASWDPRHDRRPAPRPTRGVLADAGLADRIVTSLEPKEGIALSNGTAATTAYAAFAVYDASVLYGTANLAAALSLQALRGATRALDPKVHAVRRHAGQQHAAGQILAFAAGGTLTNRATDVQDAYSIRCAPAVHGAAGGAIHHAWTVIENELSAVTDNPLFFDAAVDGGPCDDYAACIWDAYAAGNFHGDPIGIVADYLKIALAELASISERRIQYLLDEHHNRDLPANLWPDRNTAGRNSGLMIAQYTAAGLVSENKVLAHPATVDSIPTSSNAEDHVAMCTIAARHARHVVHNTQAVIAVETLAALQALEIRMREPSHTEQPSLSPTARAVHGLLRSATATAPAVAPLGDRDRALWPDIAAVTARLMSGELLAAALQAT